MQSYTELIKYMPTPGVSSMAYTSQIYEFIRRICHWPTELITLATPRI